MENKITVTITTECAQLLESVILDAEYSLMEGRKELSDEVIRLKEDGRHYKAEQVAETYRSMGQMMIHLSQLAAQL